MNLTALGALALFFILMLIPSALAICPVCTIAVGAGVIGLRAWGVDDLISGLWLGALIVSSILWTIDYLSRKKITFPLRGLAVTALYYVLFLVPLEWMRLLGDPANTVFGLEKLLVGTAVGSLAFLIAVWVDQYLRSINEKKAAFLYQKVIVPIVLLASASLMIHFLLKIFAR